MLNYNMMQKNIVSYKKHGTTWRETMIDENEMLKLQVLMALYENEDSERNVSSIAKSLKWSCNCYINS